MSLSFHFIEESYIAKMKFLLQVDNYDSYQLVTSFQAYQKLLSENLNLKVHYKIFKNAPLNEYGYIGIISRFY